MKSGTTSSLQRKRLHSQIMWVILLVLTVAPYLFGSTKPAAWALWATVVFGCGAYFYARMAFLNEPLRIPLRRMRVVTSIFFVCAAFTLWQIVPVGFPSALPENALGVVDQYVSTISLTPHDTVFALVRWCTYGLLFVLVLQLAANPQRAQLFLKLLYWSIVLHAILSLMFLLQFGDTILGIPKWKYFGDALGGFINRNSFATFLAFGSVLGLNLLLPGARLLAKRGGKPADSWGRDTLIMGVGLLIILVALIATNSRMGVFAALCGMLFSAGLAVFKRSEAGEGFRIWPLVLFFVVAAVFGAVTYGGTLTERLGRTGSDAEIRQKLYAQVIDMIHLRPLTGYGGDSFEYVFPLFHRPPVSVDLVWSKTHSTYLALWSDYGLLFGSLPILLVAIVFVQLVGVHRKMKSQDSLIRCGIGAVVVCAVHSLVDFSLEIQAVTFVFVAILAVAWARRSELLGMMAQEDAA
ncbi:O-antigen ligase family protein [Pararhizobium arenae]|uniref:O-antigen ligase family protein n=1 Tax=Pararhizobium arenae TaxID=1856850 RepID=UPI00094B35BF|nr:O-antigen ligase family protein [Pararhizobium arenae]